MEPSDGEPLQLVAFVDDQVNVTRSSTAMDVLLNDARTVGSGVCASDTVTVSASKSESMPHVVRVPNGGGSITVT